MLDIPQVRIDASTYQRPLAALSETLAQKILREGNEHLPGPDYVTMDIFVLVRYARSAYDFFRIYTQMKDALKIPTGEMTIQFTR